MKLLVSLLVCHYLADFCLTTPAMIRAKADGRDVWSIMLHAGVHALLIGACLLFWGVVWESLLLFMLVEFVSHFLIDTIKGRLTARFSALGDQQRKPYWMLFGLDQLLHLLIVVWICVYAFKLML